MPSPVTPHKPRLGVRLMSYAMFFGIFLAFKIFFPTEADANLTTAIGIASVATIGYAVLMECFYHVRQRWWRN